MHEPVTVSKHIQNAFLIARAKCHAEHAAWTKLSFVLSGRSSLPIAMINLQRQGDLDLLLRCMENEFEQNKAAEAADSLGVEFAFHYQVMLSETWVIACYEILRAIRQRDDEGTPHLDAISALATFKDLFADLELLRMPLAKYEIAKDRGLKKPLNMRAVPPNGETTDDYVYDKNDPARSHIMPTGLSSRGSMMWSALDHSVPREYWIERRDLADRLLALGGEITPAGLLEANRSGGGDES